MWQSRFRVRDRIQVEAKEFHLENKLFTRFCSSISGVTKQVGDALLLEGQQRTGRVASVGIAPWGIVERNYELVGHNREVPCHSISSPR